MTKDEVLKLAQEVCPYFDERLQGAFYEGFITALDQFPDTTKMIDKVSIKYWVQDTVESGRWVTTESMSKSTAKKLLSDEYRDAFPQGHIVEPPNSTTDVVEPEACIVGIKGSAYDPIDTKRAYTYANQPGNVVAYKLGRASSSASLQRAGDFIDSGLILLKELQVEGYGVFDIGAEYTAPPSKPWVSLTDEDREILEAVRRELDRGNQDGNAPGHGHEVPGIWDSDNGARAGKPCAWCLTWKKFTTLIDREYTLKDKKK